jgi:hypothetical protein
MATKAAEAKLSSMKAAEDIGMSTKAAEAKLTSMKAAAAVYRWQRRQWRCRYVLAMGFGVGHEAITACTEQPRAYFQRCRPREEAMKSSRGSRGDEDSGRDDSDVCWGDGNGMNSMHIFVVIDG